MKIEDLIQLLNNRLREFELSRDYARMSGDLERMNVADKEVIALKDTLYKLNLLVDTSKSAAVKEDILSEVITDGSVSVLGEYDITPYATDPLHEEKIMNILSKMGVMDTVEKIDEYIKDKYLSSPVTGEMIMSAALAYLVDVRLMMAIMQQDSSFGTAGLAVSTLNPGNVGNNDDGDTVTYESWQEGVTAVAEWLSRHRIVPTEVVPPTATSTPPTATSTPPVATTTPPIFDVTPPVGTTTPPLIDVVPPFSTTTPPVATTTPPAIDITPLVGTTTPEVIDATPPAATTTPPVDITPPEPTPEPTTSTDSTSSEQATTTAN